jgi:GR25 family glycosyltransferase involved in LPS biosynthesis
MNSFFINLDRRTDRLNTVLPEFRKIEMTVNRVPAVDGRFLEDQEYMNQYEFACLLSHKKMMKLAKDKPTVFFEDDVLFGDDFDASMKQCMLELPEDWEILYLGASFKWMVKRDYDLPVFSDNLWKADGNVLGCFAYMVRSPKKVLNFLNEERPIDVQLKQFQKEYSCFVARPRLVGCFDGYSDTRQAYRNYEEYIH